ncbi:MAG: response regulator transcription factor [Thermosynechococcaceae cyanobacterium]
MPFQRQLAVEVVGEAATGAEGLELLLTQQPDVAIIDIGLPDFDGIKLVRKFREQRASPQTHTLILTMHDEEIEVLAAFAAGADSYCVKDTGIELLFEVVLTTAEGHSWIDPEDRKYCPRTGATGTASGCSSPRAGCQNSRLRFRPS